MLFQVRLGISVSVKHKHALEERFANTASHFLLTLESETETRENPHPCVCTDVWHITLYKLQKLVTEVVSRSLEPSTDRVQNTAWSTFLFVFFNNWWVKGCWLWPMCQTLRNVLFSILFYVIFATMLPKWFYTVLAYRILYLCACHFHGWTNSY